MHTTNKFLTVKYVFKASITLMHVQKYFIIPRNCCSYRNLIEIHLTVKGQLKKDLEKEILLL